MFGRRTILATLITVAALVAIGVSAYLTWVTWQAGSVAGCTGEGPLGCDDVLTSKWSKWFGLPVSLCGGLTYAAILCLCWPAANRPKSHAMTGLFALSMLAAASAVWFVGLQAIQLQSFCIFCMTVHTCGLIVGVLTLLMLLDRSGGDDIGQMRSLLGVAADADVEPEPTASNVTGATLAIALSAAAVGLAILMGGQLLSTGNEQMAMEEIEFESQADEPTDVEPIPPESDGDELDVTEPDNTDMAIATDDQSETSEWVEDNTGPTNDEQLVGPQSAITIGSLLEGASRRIVFRPLPDGIDVSAMPVLGNPNAPHVILEMMDYTCDHCRHLHPHIHDTLERYGDQICVVIYHVPLSKKCNQHIRRDYPGKKNACDYAQTSIGIWKLAPEQFAEFHDWMLEGEKAPPIAEVKRRARALVGNSILLDKELKVDTSQRLSRQTASFKRLNSGLPILLMENGALRGVPESSQKLYDYFESRLGVSPL